MAWPHGGGALSGAGGTGGITLNLSDAGGFTAGTYTLFDFTGASTSSFDLGDLTFGTTISGFDYGLAFNGSTVELTSSVSAVPEPSLCGNFRRGGARASDVPPQEVRDAMGSIA